MSEQELRDMIDYASGFAAKRFAARGELRPMYHVVAGDGEHFVMPPPAPEKDMSLALMRSLFELRDVVRYVFLDEAWMLDRSTGISAADMEQINREGVKSHPGRIEVVMFSGEDAACGMVMARRIIHRPARGKPYLGPLEYTMEPGTVGAGASGRMVGLLPVRGMRQ